MENLLNWETVLLASFVLLCLSCFILESMVSLPGTLDSVKFSQKYRKRIVMRYGQTVRLLNVCLFTMSLYVAWAVWKTHEQSLVALQIAFLGGAVQVPLYRLLVLAASHCDLNMDVEEMKHSFLIINGFSPMKGGRFVLALFSFSCMAIYGVLFIISVKHGGHFHFVCGFPVAGS